MGSWEEKERAWPGATDGWKALLAKAASSRSKDFTAELKILQVKDLNKGFLKKVCGKWSTIKQADHAGPGGCKPGAGGVWVCTCVGELQIKEQLGKARCNS